MAMTLEIAKEMTRRLGLTKAELAMYMATQGCNKKQLSDYPATTVEEAEVQRSLRKKMHGRQDDEI